MKIELWIIMIVVFLIIDSLNNHKYSQQLIKFKKHSKTFFIIFLIFSVYIFIKKNPNESHKLAYYINGVIQHAPIDKSSKDLITPLLSMNNIPQENKILSSGLQTGTETTSRSVSGTKKKYVAAGQGWKCKDCNVQLDAWFEVDHIVRLADGGSNHVSNLVALCRNCHGKKTCIENL
jgi:hypothetical protein